MNDWIRRLFKKRIPDVPSYRLGEFTKDEIGIIRDALVEMVHKQYTNDHMRFLAECDEPNAMEHFRMTYLLMEEAHNAWKQAVIDGPHPDDSFSDVFGRD